MNELVKINFAKIKKEAIIPSKNEGNAGYDIYPCFEADFICIEPHNTKLIPTGIASAISEDYYFQIEERGSTGSKGIKKSSGVIDSSYRGEWFVAITNSTDSYLFISKVDSLDDTVCYPYSSFFQNSLFYPYNKAIAQAILLPVPKTEIKIISYEELLKIPSNRGTGSLGSTNK